MTRQSLDENVRSKVSAISVAIPTFGRDQILIDTVTHLLRQRLLPSEMLVLAQSADHTPSAKGTQSNWSKQGRIRWLRLPRPSIPAAMNVGLLQSQSELLLFIDDDIVPEQDFLASHLAAHMKSDAAVVAGRERQIRQGTTQWLR